MTRTKHLIGIATLVGAAVAAAAGGVLLRDANPDPSHAVARTVAAVPLSDAELRRCADCHADAARNAFETPHVRTLARADQKRLVSRFSGPGGAADGSLPDFAFIERDGRLWAEAGRPRMWIPVDWIFGSGKHAQTPVSVRDEPGVPHECLELHASWYPDRGIGLTIGHDGHAGLGLLSLGDVQPADVTRSCFGCHTTGMQVDEAGRIDFDGFAAGVRCDRCHPGAREHLASDGAAAMERLSELTPTESLERCGVCHRTVESLPSHPDAEDLRLARFAPVGLSLSACFLRQGGERFDCATCHDPHAPASDDPSHYVAKCVECHTTRRMPCPAQPMTSNCLPCHMPKVTVERHIRFTDHWIRVREPADSNPEVGPGGNGA